MNPDRLTKGGRLVVTLHWQRQPSWVPTGRSTSTADRMSMKQWSMPAGDMPRVDDARFRQLGLFAELTQHLTTAPA